MNKWIYSIDVIQPGVKSKDPELYIDASDGIDSFKLYIPMSVAKLELLSATIGVVLMEMAGDPEEFFKQSLNEIGKRVDNERIVRKTKAHQK